MIWDFAEANPFGGSSGDARAQLNYILETLDHLVAVSPGRPAQVVRGKAQRLPLAERSVDAVITDPPYYDNVPYADLSDLFYVWHKRALSRIFPALYSARLTPKRAEIIAEPQRHERDKGAAAQYYEDQMSGAFEEAHRVLKSEGLMVVVYAHKTTLGWSTLVDSLRRAGFGVTEAWPLSTEMPDRVGQQGKAGLASSIFLIARKRTAEATVANYATLVRPEMVSIVERRVRELIEVGISGADLVIAAVGAGLRPFTRYERVELPNGEELPSARFLDEVQREVLEAVLAAVFEADRRGVGQVDRTSRFYVLARYQYGGAKVDFGVINVLAQGLGIELSGGLAEGKTRLIKQEKSKIQVLGHDVRGKQPTLGLPTGAAPAPLIDVLHRLLWLLENDRTAISVFLDKSRADTGRLRLLANALKGRALSGGGETADRSDEQKATDRLLAQWSRVVETRASLPLFDGARKGSR